MEGNDIRIKVKTDVLKNVSDDASLKISKARLAFDQADEIIRGNTKYWEGSGGRSALVSYTSRVDSIDRVFNELTNHIKDLLVIAGVYEDADNLADTLINVLDEDVIQ